MNDQIYIKKESYQFDLDKNMPTSNRRTIHLERKVIDGKIILTLCVYPDSEFEDFIDDVTNFIGDRICNIQNGV